MPSATLAQSSLVWRSRMKTLQRSQPKMAFTCSAISSSSFARLVSLDTTPPKFTRSLSRFSNSSARVIRLFYHVYFRKYSFFGDFVQEDAVMHGSGRRVSSAQAAAYLGQAGGAAHDHRGGLHRGDISQLAFQHL